MRNPGGGRGTGLPAAILILLCAGALAMAGAGQLARWWPPLDVVNSAAPLVAIVAASCLLASVFVPRRGARWLVALAVPAGVAAGERLLPEAIRPIAAASAETDRDVRIVSFNVFHANRNPRATIRAILAEHPDIVLLQEAASVLALHDPAFEKAFPYRSVCWRDRCDPAFASRWPLGAMHYRFRNAAGRPEGAALVQAVVHPDGGRAPFAIASLHLARPTEAGAFHERRLRLLGDTIATYGTPGLLLGGDFNLTPWSFALQSLDARISPMVRANRASATYPGNLAIGRVALPPLMPIDQLYVGPAWRVRSVRVMPPAGSDHRGQVIVLQQIA